MKGPQIVFALGAALILLPAAVAPAAIKNWTDGTGNWSVPANWSGGTTPALNDVVNIVNTDGVTRNVTCDVAAPSLGLSSIDLTGGASTTTNTLSMLSNVSLQANAIVLGGYNGAGFTNGRGALNQSAGMITTNAGWDLILAWGAGSAGTYTLSGGTLVANQAEIVGTSGTGVFNHSGGTNTINTSAVGNLFVGYNAGASGTYNLSGTGALTVNTSEYVGYSGNGIFNQTGGTNLVTGSGGVTLGYASGSSGSYNISGGTLTSNGAITATH